VTPTEPQRVTAAEAAAKGGIVSMGDEEHGNWEKTYLLGRLGWGRRPGRWEQGWSRSLGGCRHT
jgi:hypothetical protein